MIALIPALRRSSSSGKLAGFFLFERGDMSTVGVFIDYQNVYRVAAKRGIHGLSPCCALCHGTDGLQEVYIDNEPTTLCCTVITEIMLRWPSTIRYADGGKTLEAVPQVRQPSR